MIFLRLCLFLIFVSYVNIGMAQHQRLENRKNFDKEILTFGFQFGYASCGMTLTPSLSAFKSFGYTSIQSYSNSGATIGMLSSVKLGTPILRLRFIPGFSFQERVISYHSISKNNSNVEVNSQEHINASNLDFPMLFQIRTLRYGNFTSFVLVGSQYSIDLQSLEYKSQNFTDPFLKFTKKYWTTQVGGGVEFFNEYFKFGLEIKYSQGLTNVLIPDNTSISRSLSSVYINAWIFTITFEGGE